MTETRRPNRRGLEPHEIARLDAIEAKYAQKKRDAYAACTEALSAAALERAEGIIGLIDEGERSTQTRVAEQLGVHRNTLVHLRRTLKERRAARAA